MGQALLSDLQTFLLERITTHEALRAVRWLAEHGNVAVTASELGKKLGLSEETVTEALESLVEAELVQREGPWPFQYRYQSLRPELDTDLRRTLMLVEQDNVQVTCLLAANSIHRLRQMAYAAYAPALLRRATASAVPSSDRDPLVDATPTASLRIEESPPRRDS